jgi:adenine/guanine phosphoribosyltransferase-like PRPP-binding protein
LALSRERAKARGEVCEIVRAGDNLPGARPHGLFRGMKGEAMQEPHQFWQALEPAGASAPPSGAGHVGFYPATLPDGRALRLPIRALPGPDGLGVASLILNQASFAVHDALSEALAAHAAAFRPDLVVGLPTLGLSLASDVARRLGHPRFVALGTSRKFWYDDSLSEPLKSITTPGGGKQIYLDPRMLPLIQGRRVLLVDDVVSSGSSLASVLRLLAKVDVRPTGIAVAMEQGTLWQGVLPAPVRGALRTPLLRVIDDQGGCVAA